MWNELEKSQALSSLMYLLIFIDAIPFILSLMSLSPVLTQVWSNIDSGS